MRILLTTLFTFLLASSSFAGENIELSLKEKGYFFRLVTKGSQSEVYWKKSGFEMALKKNLKSCWLNSIEKEVRKLKTALLVINSNSSLGDKIKIKSQDKKVEKTLKPSELALLDKKLTHIYNLQKSGEGKCIK